jgi:hypothetical protein
MLARVSGCDSGKQRASTMSNRAIDFVTARRDLKPSEKLVAFIFANHADPKGGCFPALDTVALEAGLSIDTVYRCVKALEAKSLIFRADVRGRRINGTRKTLLTIVLYSSEAIAHAAGLGFDQKAIADRRAMTSVVGQPSKLRSNQPCKLPRGQPSNVRFPYIEPPKLKIEPSGTRANFQSRRGVWIRKGTREWFSWYQHHLEQGHTWLFNGDELTSFTSKQGTVGRLEATSLPPPSVRGKSQC